jgi:hypothetical protein
MEKKKFKKKRTINENYEKIFTIFIKKKSQIYLTRLKINL